MSTVTQSLRYYLAECYHPDVIGAPLDEVAAVLHAVCVAETAAGTPVHLLLAIAAPTDDVVFTVFAARSPEPVIAMCAGAGHPVERITPDIEALVTADAVIGSTLDSQCWFIFAAHGRAEDALVLSNAPSAVVENRAGAQQSPPPQKGGVDPT